MPDNLKILEAKTFFKHLISERVVDIPELHLAKYLNDRNISRIEDTRSTDWTYFFDFKSMHRVLLIGFGFGAITDALSSRKCEISLLDFDEESRDLAFTYTNQQNESSLKIYSSYDAITNSNQFDLIYLSTFPFGDYSFDFHLKQINRLLNDNGKFIINVANKIQFRPSKNSLTLRKYKKKVSMSKVSNYEIYARLPDIDSIPLFYFPLEENTLKYFLNSILNQIENISPEGKKKHYFKYKLIIFVKRFLTKRYVLRAIRYVFPSYTIVASK